MKYLLYDSSMEGLFSSIFFVCKNRLEDISIRKQAEYTPGLFDVNINPDLDPHNAARFVSSVKNGISKEALRKIVMAFLSEEENVENVILDFVKKGLKRGKDILEDLADPAVLRMDQLSCRTERELHRFEGLVRFRELKDGSYYAAINPDTYILVLLRRHFVARLRDQDWIIHDIKRNKALVYKNRCVELARIIEIAASMGEGACYTEDEILYSTIWKEYCKKISIPERKNIKLKMQFMPKKYWKQLIEIDGTI